MAMNILKAEQVKALTYQSTKKSLNDGGGLRVVAKSNGKKIFEFSCTFQSVRNVTSLGSYPTVSLALARTKAKAYRDLIEQGINPIEKNKDDKMQKKRNCKKKSPEIYAKLELKSFKSQSREDINPNKSVL